MRKKTFKKNLKFSALKKNWEKTTARTCRYGSIAGNIFKDAEIIWENSESDWQGSANVLAAMPDGSFIHYAWTYGSCSGCDEWESRELTGEEIEQEMRRAMAILKDKETLLSYLKIDKDTKIPSANTPTNGSVPGMLKFLCGGYGTDFEEMGKAAKKWLSPKKDKNE